VVLAWFDPAIGLIDSAVKREIKENIDSAGQRPIYPRLTAILGGSISPIARGKRTSRIRWSCGFRRTIRCG
jgi:hypothetical protein